MNRKEAIRAHMDAKIFKMLHPEAPVGGWRGNPPPEFTTDTRARLGAVRADIASGKGGTPIRLAHIGRDMGRPDLFWPLILDAFDAEDVRSDDGPSECAAVLRACP